MPEASRKKLPTTADGQIAKDVKDSFGPALKKARGIRHLTLDELARRCECSASAISKIENQKAAPSLGMLYRICRALSINVETLLQSHTTTRSIVTRAGDHSVHHTAGLKSSTLLKASPEHRMESAILEMAPGWQSGEPFVHGPGEVLGYVLEGRLKLTVGGKAYSVAAGDSFAFSYDQPHSFANTSTRKTRVLFVLSPPLDFTSRPYGGDSG
jgi:transcriptional regulator with XRE-family HTH domain